MSNYTITFRKNNFEYTLSSEDKVFTVEYINSIFRQLKSVNTDMSQVEKNEEISTVDEINSQMFPYSQNKQVEVSAEPFILEDVSTEQQNSVLTASDNIEENQNDNYTEEVMESIKPEESFFVEEIKPFSFDNILEEKINNPIEMEEVETIPSQAFDELIKSKNTESLSDYLIITAYYMLEYEHKDKFQLKELNQKLYSSMKMLVDHKTIQKAIDDGFVKVIPDLTGIANVTEYALTQTGEEYYRNGFA